MLPVGEKTLKRKIFEEIMEDMVERCEKMKMEMERVNRNKRTWVLRGIEGLPNLILVFPFRAFQ